MERSASEQGFVDRKLDDALSEAGLPVTSPIRGILNRDAVVFEASGISGQRMYGVKIPRPSGDVGLRERLDELKGDAMYRHNFSQGTPVVAASRCLRPTTENFNKIARGEVKVSAV
jgi:hypothetical protein